MALWQPGMLITADRLNAMNPQFTSWTPTWSTSTGNATPTFGNATINCRYAQTGNFVSLIFEVVFGSSTNFNAGSGSDNWRFSLPVAASAAHQVIGFCELNKDTDERAMSRMRCTTTTDFELEISSGTPADIVLPGGLADAISPWTWASGHAIRGTASYESAT